MVIQIIIHYNLPGTTNRPSIEACDPECTQVVIKYSYVWPISILELGSVTTLLYHSQTHVPGPLLNAVKWKFARSPFSAAATATASIHVIHLYHPFIWSSKLSLVPHSHPESDPLFRLTNPDLNQKPTPTQQFTRPHCPRQFCTQSIKNVTPIDNLNFSSYTNRQLQKQSNELTRRSDTRDY